MSVERHKELIYTYFASFFEGSVDIYDRLLHASFYVCHLRDRGKPVSAERQGPVSFKRGIPAFRAAFPDGSIIVEDIVVEGDCAIACWHFQGIQQGEFLGVAPTGKQITYMGVNGFRIQNQQLMESWDMQDSLSLFQQLGLLPATDVILAVQNRR